MIYEELQVRVVYNSFTFSVLSDGKMMDSLRKTEENNMKKAIALMLCLLLLAGCAAPVAETTQAPTESVPEFTGQAPVETESTLRFGGDFGLYLNGDEVTIHLPEQFSGQVIDGSCMGAFSDDQLSFLTYTLSDANVEDLRLAIELDANEAIQSGYYKSHGEGEQIEGFTTMYLIYTDSAYNFYAWKELENSTLFLCAELEDMELNLADLIASVELNG